MSVQAMKPSHLAACFPNFLPQVGIKGENHFEVIEMKRGDSPEQQCSVLDHILCLLL